MKRTASTTGLAALALTMSFGLAACGSDEASGSSSDTKSDSSMSEKSPSPSDDAMAADAGAETFGPGCSAIPTSGDGSLDGMATAPVATAASANPLLKTLVAAVTKAGLVDTLNSAEALTVFAPDRRRVRQDPEEDPERGPRRQGDADQDPDPPRHRGSARPGRDRRQARPRWPGTR